MSDTLREQLALLPDYLSRHVLLSITALSIGITIGLLMSIVITRVRVLQGPVLMAASAVQTIPSLAMLALMVPLLREIGFRPAAIALVLYSMLPVIRNTVTGIDDVDPDIVEAGRGLGMTPGQLLIRVQIPLAMPVIVAGIRTATIWVVGIATLSTPVGATSLGNYIFSGLQTRNYTAVIVGCVAAAALALVLDWLIRAIEVAVSRRNRTLIAAATCGVLVLLGAGLSPLLLRGAGTQQRPAVRIGAKTFTEQYVLARLIADRLEAAGYRAQVLESLGSTVVFDALAGGRLDCYVDYTGTIWATVMDREGNPGAEEVFGQVRRWLSAEHGITCLGRLGFENTYALAMPREAVEQRGIRSIDELAPYAPELTIGGTYEFFGRPEWTRLQETYGLQFREAIGMNAALMYSAVDTGDVDLVAAFSTDGRIAAFDLDVLQDTRRVFPPYDAVLLLSERAAADPKLAAALRPLIGAVTAEAMRQANKLVDVDGRPVAEAARTLQEALTAPASPSGQDS